MVNPITDTGPLQLKDIEKESATVDSDDDGRVYTCPKVNFNIIIPPSYISSKEIYNVQTTNLNCYRTNDKVLGLKWKTKEVLQLTCKYQEFRLINSFQHRQDRASGTKL